MVFSSATFLLVFLPALLIVYYNPIWKSRTFRNITLFVASVVFYAWGEPVFVFVLLLSTVVTWAIGLSVEKSEMPKKKRVLVLGISLHVLLLFACKYLGFFARQVGWLIHRDFSYLSISLPIGISFFTFQLMSYLFDIYYGKAKSQKNVLYVGLYISMFSQLIAGPIVRYNQISDELSNRRETREDITSGVIRFVYGLSKKVLIANYLAPVADNIFMTVRSTEISVLGAWLGTIAYALQIYFDFSGYSDMAIGLGRIFGFHFSENFNYPYVSRSVTEFWKRWHISLSTWFRDYVYIPLGGNRVKKSRWVFNLFVVWLLTGIWHGANWTFVVWGLLYFLMLLLEKLTDFPKRLGPFSHLYTLAVVLIAWAFFRSEDLASAIRYVGCMFGVGVNGFADSSVGFYLWKARWVLFAGVLFSMPLLSWAKNKTAGFPAANSPGSRKAFRVAESLVVVALFLIALVVTISSSYNPFIYFNF